MFFISMPIFARSHHFDLFELEVYLEAFRAETFIKLGIMFCVCVLTWWRGHEPHLLYAPVFV